MAQLFSLPRPQVFDNSGNPLPGARLYFSENGTSVPKNAFSDSSLNVPHTNPVIADSAGVFDAIWLDNESGTYTVRLTDVNNVQQWSEDNIGALPPALSQEEIGEILYSMSDSEIAAGLDPDSINYVYPVGDMRRWGAVGDGVTDDTLAIQTAINVISEEPNGTVELGGLRYLVNTLTIDASHITIRNGVLRASATIPASGAIILSLSGDTTADTDGTVTNQPLLDGIYGVGVQSVRSANPGSLTDVHFDDIEFEGDGNANAIRGVWMTGFTRGCRIMGCYFKDIKGDAICLNGSWSFALLSNHINGDGTNGTGISLGRTGNGKRSNASVCNGVTLFSNECTNHANGCIWNFGVGGSISGNVWEFNVTDGFSSQSVEGVTYTGNYHERNSGDNLQLGGTNGSDFAEDWVVEGNYFNADTGNNIRLNGCQRCRIGKNNFGGTVTQQYFIASGIGQYITDCTIEVTDVTSTYISNAATEANAATNTYHQPNSKKWINTKNGNFDFTVLSPAQITYKNAGGAGETWTVKSNANVPMPIGTVLECVNNGGDILTVQVEAPDTLAGSGAIAAASFFKLVKVETQVWAVHQ